jgi:hypothetical protein
MQRLRSSARADVHPRPTLACSRSPAATCRRSTTLLRSSRSCALAGRSRGTVDLPLSICRRTCIRHGRICGANHLWVVHAAELPRLRRPDAAAVASVQLGGWSARSAFGDVITAEGRDRELDVRAEPLRSVERSSRLSPAIRPLASGQRSRTRAQANAVTPPKQRRRPRPTPARETTGPIR